MRDKSLVPVGRVVRPHGVRGELVIEPLRAVMEPLALGKTIYLGEHAEPREVEGLRHHRGRWLIRLVGCGDRDAAEALRGQVIQIERPRQALPPGSVLPPGQILPPGHLYGHDDEIIGLAVFTEMGESLGEVTEIIVTGANDVYVVAGPNGDILLPAIPDVIRHVDLAAQRMTVHLLDGLR